MGFLNNGFPRPGSAPEGFNSHSVEELDHIPSSPEGFSFDFTSTNYSSCIPSGLKALASILLKICAVSPQALKALASVLSENLRRIPSGPGVFSLDFVYKFAPYPLDVWRCTAKLAHVAKIQSGPAQPII